MDNIDTIRKVTGVIQDYRSEMDSYNRLKVSVELRQKELKEEKAQVLEQIKSLGFSNREEVQKEFDQANSQIASNLAETKHRLMALKLARESLRGEKSAYENMLSEKKKKIVDLRSQQALCLAVSDFLRVTSDTVRRNSVHQIEDLVSKAVNKIFDFNPPLNFKMEISTKASSSSINFMIEDPLNGFSSSILNSYGGGLGDVVGVVLRLALLEFQVPKNTAPIVLDEVGKFISCNHQRRFAEFLKEWSKTFGRQIIMVTHRPEVIEYADKVFRIYKDGDTSKIVEDKNAA